MKSEPSKLHWICVFLPPDVYERLDKFRVNIHPRETRHAAITKLLDEHEAKK